MQGLVLYHTAGNIIFENEEGLGRLSANLTSYPLRVGDSVWFHSVSEGLGPLTLDEIRSVWTTRERLIWTERQYMRFPFEFQKDDPFLKPEDHLEVDLPPIVYCETYSISPDTTPIFKVNKYLAVIASCYEPDKRRLEKATKAFYQVGFLEQVMKCFKTLDDAYRRISDFSVRYKDFNTNFFSKSKENHYVRAIYKTEERTFFNRWYKNVVERSVRLYNLEPKEIRHTGYDITKITSMLWNKPHLLVGINEGVLTRLQNTLRINTSEADMADRRLMLWIDTECSKRSLLGVTYTQAKIANAKDSDRLMDLIEGDLELVIIPKGKGLSKVSIREPEIPLLMTKQRYEVSKYTAERLMWLHTNKNMYPMGDVAIKDRKLDQVQREAIRQALIKNIHCISGYAGTGKTTIIREITNNLTNWDKSWILLAFTGIATYNMRKIVATDHTSTIDLLLTQLSRKKGIKEFKALKHIIIDESSMISTITLKRLLQAMKEYDVKAKVTFIGDPNQLPPVGAGIFFETLVEHDLLSHSRLKTVYRTRMEPDNTLYDNSTRIAEHRKPLSSGDEFIVMKGVLKTVLVQVRDIIASGYKPSDVKVLCPYKKKKNYNTMTTPLDDLNRGIQKIANPDGAQIPGTEFRVNDQVMITVNDHTRGVFNGSQGAISKYDDKVLFIKFEDGTEHEYKLTRTRNTGAAGENKATRSLSDITLAYALTIHKSQGMQWPIVIIYLPPNSRPSPDFLNKKLMYTAVTRAIDVLMIVTSTPTIVDEIAFTHASIKWDPLPALLED